MSRKRKGLYIGNKGVSNNANTTYMETLSVLLREEGYDIISASSKSNKLLRMLDMLRYVFRHRDADFILIDTYSTLNFYYAVAVANLARFFKIPYIPILHGGNLPDRIHRSKSQSRKLFGSALMNVAPSGYLYDAFQKEGYKNLKLIPNSIDILNYPFLLRKRATPRLLWVRSFSELYNPTLAISVLKKLKDKGIEAFLCMVGPDVDERMAICKQLAEKDTLKVTFTGRLSKKDWVELSRDYSIFINTTNVDNTPVSVIEAMALGIPIVSTNVGGLPFLIQHEEDGLLVNPNNAEIFSEAVVELLQDPALSMKLSKNGRSKAETFDWNVIKQAWIDLLG